MRLPGDQAEVRVMKPVKRSSIEELPTTVEGLCNMARRLGYRDPLQQLMNRDGTSVGDFLYFLEDNPAACEAIFNWVLDEGADRDGQPLEDDDDDEMDPDEDEADYCEEEG